MSHTSRLPAAAAVLLVALAAILTAGAATAATHSEAPVGPEVGAPVHCAAPPCGYIWPRITIDTEIASPYAMSKLDDFPRESEVHVRYSWDLEQEGTGISDPSEEMKITIVVTRTPSWMRAELDQNTCSFMLVPVITEYDVCTLTLTVTIDDTALPASEDEMREMGHRLMLFAASEESGTYMKSYGLEDIRFDWDLGPPAAPSTGDAAEAPAPAPLFLVLGLLAFALARRRR